MRIAMWSGPRNISTAMMRSFEARGDAWVSDEPLYAPYLLATGLEHPMRAEVLARHENDWRAVARWITGPVPGGKAVWYQKHMAHHLLPEMERAAFAGLTHAFLIREPRAMIASLQQKLGPPRLDDTGLPQQVELFRAVCDTSGAAPPVIDARDVLLDPRRVLGKLCAALGIPFTAAMLSWPPGRRDTDGAWAPHWYDSVEKSTCFAPWREREVTLPAALERVHQACVPLYRELHQHRLH